MRTLLLVLVLLGPATSLAHGFLPGDGRFKASFMAGAEDLREEDEREAQAAAAARQRHWYGWKILLADLAAPILGSIAAIPLSANEKEATIVGVSIFTLIYVSGGPLMHVLQGHRDVAGTSFAVRVVPVLMVAGGVGLLLALSDGHATFIPGLLLASLGIGGMLLAPIGDIAGLAWETPPKVAVLPAIELGPRRASVGLALRF